MIIEQEKEKKQIENIRMHQIVLDRFIPTSIVGLEKRHFEVMAIDARCYARKSITRKQEKDS